MSDDLVLTLNQGNARKAAEVFGFVQALVETGHAYGFNIVTGYNDVPTRDLDPIYLRVAGIEAQFLFDSTSYAWDSSGLVVSSDLLLVGATGYVGAAPPATSWVRLPVPVAGLNAAPATVADLTLKANSGAIPVGFNPDNPASVTAALAGLSATGTDRYAVAQAAGADLIGPVLLIEDDEIYTGPTILVEEFPYALVLPTEEFTITTGTVARDGTSVVVPAAVVTVEALAPEVVTDEIQALVPAAVVTVQAYAPEVTISVPEGAVVDVPAAVVTVAAAAPAVLTDAVVAVPAAVITVAARVPSVTAGGAVAYRYYRFDQITKASGFLEVTEWAMVNDGVYVNAGSWTISSPGGQISLLDSPKMHDSITTSGAEFRAVRITADTPTGDFLQYDHGSSVAATGFRYALSSNATIRNVTGFRIRGSNDGSTFTTIGTRSGLTNPFTANGQLSAEIKFVP
jgi:hypothetical protein